MRLALQAAELTGWRDPAVLHVLARAYAAGRRFNDAVRTAEMAASLVPDSMPALAGEIRAHLGLYRQNRLPAP